MRVDHRELQSSGTTRDRGRLIADRHVVWSLLTKSRDQRLARIGSYSRCRQFREATALRAMRTKKKWLARVGGAPNLDCDKSSFGIGISSSAMASSSMTSRRPDIGARTVDAYHGRGKESRLNRVTGEIIGLTLPQSLRRPSYRRQRRFHSAPLGNGSTKSSVRTHPKVTRPSNLGPVPT